MTFGEKKNDADCKKINGFQGLEAEGSRNEQMDHRECLRYSNVLYNTVMMVTCPYAFVQTHNVCTTKSEPYCKLQA